jgi:quercetin dioxygenase-like cupin family protein
MTEHVANEKRFVFKMGNTPMLEMPDGQMRDQFMITDETCGARDLTAGLYWIRPRSEGHEDTHTFDESFYVIRGRAIFRADDKPFEVQAGDVVFCPAGTKHRFDNPYDEPYQGFWALGAKWSDLASIQAEVSASWHEVDPSQGWHLA